MTSTWDEITKLHVEVCQKPTHTDKYLMFDSYNPLEHKLGVICSLQQQADTIPTDPEAKEKEKSILNKH